MPKYMLDFQWISGIDVRLTACSAQRRRPITIPLHSGVVVKRLGDTTLEDNHNSNCASFHDF